MGGGDLRAVDHPATALRQAVGVVGTVATAAGAGGAATSVVARVAASLANVTLLASNANRRGGSIYNNIVAGNLFVKLGATASIGAGTESFTTRVVPGALYEIPFGYTGIIDGIWDVAPAAGEALTTELT